MPTAQEKFNATMATWKSKLTIPDFVDKELLAAMNLKGLTSDRKPSKLNRLKGFFDTLAKHLDISYTEESGKSLDSLKVSEIDQLLASILAQLGADKTWFAQVKRAPAHVVDRFFQATLMRGIHPILKSVKADVSTPIFDKIWSCVQHADEGQAAPPPMTSKALEPLLRKTFSYTNAEPIGSIKYKVNDSLKRVQVPEACDSRSEYLCLFVRYHTSEGNKFATFEEAVTTYCTTQAFGSRPITNSFINVSLDEMVSNDANVKASLSKQRKVGRPMLGPQVKPLLSTKQKRKTLFSNLSSEDEEYLQDKRNPVFKKRRQDWAAQMPEGNGVITDESSNTKTTSPLITFAGNDKIPKRLQSLSKKSAEVASPFEQSSHSVLRSYSATDTDSDRIDDSTNEANPLDSSMDSLHAVKLRQSCNQFDAHKDSHGLFEEFKELTRQENMLLPSNTTGNVKADKLFQVNSVATRDDAGAPDTFSLLGRHVSPAAYQGQPNPAPCKAGTLLDYGLSNFTEFDIAQGILDATPVAFPGQTNRQKTPKQIDSACKFTPSQVTHFLRNNQDLDVADPSVRRFVLKAVAQAGDVRSPPKPDKGSSSFAFGGTTPGRTVGASTAFSAAQSRYVSAAKARGMDVDGCIKMADRWQSAVEKSKAALQRLNNQQMEVQHIVDSDFESLPYAVKFSMLPNEFTYKMPFREWARHDRAHRSRQATHRIGYQAGLHGKYKAYAKRWMEGRSTAVTEAKNKVELAYKQRHSAIVQHRGQIAQAQQHVQKYKRLGSAIRASEPPTPSKSLQHMQYQQQRVHQDVQRQGAEQARAAGADMQQQRLDARAAASRVHDTRRATRRQLPDEVLEKPTINMWVDQAVDEEDEYAKMLRKRARTLVVQLRKLRADQKACNLRWLQCVVDPYGHNPCGPSRAICVEAHGGMRSCPQCQCRCKRSTATMIMDQTMLEQEQASERKDLISDITESKMELKMLNQDQGNSSDPELAVYPESVHLAWQSHYDKVEASHQLVQTRPLNEYEKAALLANKGDWCAKYETHAAQYPMNQEQEQPQKIAAQPPSGLTFSSPPKLRHSGSGGAASSAGSSAFSFTPFTPKKPRAVNKDSWLEPLVRGACSPSDDTKDTPDIVMQEHNRLQVQKQDQYEARGPLNQAIQAQQAAESKLQATNHPSHPSRQNTGIIIKDSGAKFSTRAGQERERAFGHGNELYTGLELKHGDKARMSIMNGTMFIFKDKVTTQYKAGYILGSLHDGEPVGPEGSNEIHRCGTEVIYRAQGKTKSHYAPLHTILQCVSMFEDCPSDMQQDIRRKAQLADQAMHKAQLESAQQQAQLVSDLKTKGASNEEAIDMALSEDDDSSESEATPIKTKGTKKPKKSPELRCNDQDAAEHDAVAEAGKSKGKPPMPKLINAKGRSSAPEATVKGSSDSSGSDTSASDSDKDSDDAARSPRDMQGQMRFGSQFPMSLNDIMITSNVQHANEWVGHTICLDTEPASFAIVASANTRRFPTSFKYNTVGGTRSHSISAASCYRALLRYADLPDAVKPGSKASEAAEVAAEMQSCPKALLRKFGPTHQNALLAAEKACHNGNILSLQAFADGGKAVSFLHIVKMLSENEARSLDSITALTSTVNGRLESKNIMMSSKEVLNWVFFQWDVHPLSSLCARPHSNPRTPSETETIGINSYKKKGLMSIDTIKDAIETLAAILDPVYGFEFAQRTRSNMILTLDEAKQLVPGSAAAAVNCAISWGLRQADIKVTAAIKNYSGKADSNGKVIQDNRHPVLSFSIFENWADVKMLKLLPLAGGMMGSGSSSFTTSDEVSKLADKLENLWNRQPLRDYKPSPKLVEYAKEWCRTKNITYKSWKATIDAWDKLQGQKYGSHKHQYRCFLRYALPQNHCSGIKVCARCYVETQWNKGIKKPPTSGA